MLVLALLAAYLLGSIPFGLLLTRLAGQGDIRAVGSGNIGATNVLRTGKKGLALATLLLDIGKGAAAVLLVHAFDPALAAPAAVVAVLGHLYPVWLKFKGGKGVATSIGVWLALDWRVGLALIAIWLAVFAWKRFSSLAALGAFWFSVPIAVWCDRSLFPYAMILAFLVYFRHRDNIARLACGEEPRFGGAPKP